MLKQRILTAIILVAIMLLVILKFPPLAFNLFMAALISIGAWEWSRLAGYTKLVARGLYLIVSLAVMAVLYLQSSEQRELILLAGCIWWVFAYFLIRRFPQLGAWWKNPLLLSLVGMLVLMPGWSALLEIRNSPYHIQLNLLLIGMVASADTGAYFTGKRFGKHKLAPEVSPNKTWEGFAGGMLCSSTLAVIVLLISDIGASLSVWFFIKVVGAALAVAVMSVIGDLFESLIKRQSNVKDSGNILPGHGGILDRIDGFTAALPIYVLALNLVPLA